MKRNPWLTKLEIKADKFLIWFNWVFNISTEYMCPWLNIDFVPSYPVFFVVVLIEDNFALIWGADVIMCNRANIYVLIPDDKWINKLWIH